MKWTSIPAVVLLCVAFPVVALDGADLLRTSEQAAPLANLQPDESRSIPPGRFTLTPTERDRLLHASRNAVLRLPSVDAQLAVAGAPLVFRRYDAFAAGTRVRRVSPRSTALVEPDRRLYFLAMSPQEGAGLALDPATGAISGFATRGDSRVRMSGFAGSIEVTPVEALPDGVNECGTVLGDQPVAVQQGIAAGGMTSRSEAWQGTTLSFEAVVAVDTDTEWMAGKSNDTTTAMNWITDTFLAMNVFYERDVETRLLIGDVTLRTGSDPYTVATGRSQQLDEFSDYWFVNMGAVDRDFATLFSGRDIGSNSFSGIAWVNQYCNTGAVAGSRTVGSYSFNAIGTNRTPANTAAFVGHEIGHNLGSPHTHCYSPPVDQCYNAEQGCFSGTPTCPAGGKGTVMSYCHYGPPNGANCGTSKLEFHPTVQALIEDRLAANSPGCIAAVAPPPDQVILNDGFEGN